MGTAAVTRLDQLSLQHHVLRYHHDGTDWTLPLEDLRIIGEYTTPNGPAQEDYFVVFIDRNAQQYEVPARLVTNETAATLRQSIGEFHFGLAHATDLESRIMWPPDYAGTPLFDFARIPARTITERLRHIVGSYDVETQLSSQAQKALADVRVAAAAVLVANADPYVVQLVIEALQQHHEVTVEHAEGKDAVERLTQRSYQVLLVDLAASGYDVLEYLREHRTQQGHVVAITDDTLPPNQRTLVDEILVKPVRQDALKRLEQYVTDQQPAGDKIGG